MDEGRALLVWQFVRVVLLALGLWLAIGEALDFRGPDPEVPRLVLEGAFGAGSRTQGLRAVLLTWA